MYQINRWLRFNLMYFHRPHWDTDDSPPELIDFIKKSKPGNAIDLGCGTGTNLVTLGKAGWRVTGVDFAVKAVAEARRKLRAAGVHGEVRSGDVSHLRDLCRTGNCLYDLVLDIACYHNLFQRSREAYRKHLLEILAPGGTFLLFGHLRKPGVEGQFGITQEDMDGFQSILKLEARKDTQEPGGLNTVWACFRFNDPNSNPAYDRNLEQQAASPGKLVA